MKRHEQLHEILLSYADTDEQRELCRAIQGLMEADGLSDTEMEQQIVSALKDGLTDGNWPWAQPYVDREGLMGVTRRFRELARKARERKQA